MTYMGHSVGRWEGDTLVVDVTEFNGKNWFDRAGNYHSDALHLTERFTPITKDAIHYEVTIEDPKAFTRPWKISMPLYRRLEPTAQLLEYRCIEFVEEFLFGGLRKQPLVKRWEGETMIVDITRKVPPGDKLYDRIFVGIEGDLCFASETRRRRRLGLLGLTGMSRIAFRRITRLPPSSTPTSLSASRPRSRRWNG